MATKGTKEFSLDGASPAILVVSLVTGRLTAWMGDGENRNDYIGGISGSEFVKALRVAAKANGYTLTKKPAPVNRASRKVPK